MKKFNMSLLTVTLLLGSLQASAVNKRSVMSYNPLCIATANSALSNNKISDKTAETIVSDLEDLNGQLTLVLDETQDTEYRITLSEVANFTHQSLADGLTEIQKADPELAAKIKGHCGLRNLGTPLAETLEEKILELYMKLYGPAQ